MKEINWVLDGLQKHQVKEYDLVTDIIEHGYYTYNMENYPIYFHFGTSTTDVKNLDNTYRKLGSEPYYHALVEVNTLDRVFRVGEVDKILREDKDAKVDGSRTVENVSEEDIEHYIVLNNSNKFRRSIHNYIAVSLAVALSEQYEKYIPNETKDLGLLMAVLSSYFTTKLLESSDQLNIVRILDSLDNSIDYNIKSLDIMNKDEWEMHICHTVVCNKLADRELKKPTNVTNRQYNKVMELGDILVGLCDKVSRCELVTEDECKRVREQLDTIKSIRKAG